MAYIYYTRQQDRLIVKMLKKGKTHREIAEVVGHSKASVETRIRRILRPVATYPESMRSRLVQYRVARAA